MGLHPLTADTEGFRTALGCHASSVNVITVHDDAHRPLGMTATAFSSVSTDPLLVLVCVNRSTRTYGHIAAAGRFGVNVLGSRARNISDHCARPGSDKTLSAEWLVGTDGWQAPALSGALAFLDCAVEQDVTAGTHAVLIGRVRGIGIESGGRAGDGVDDGGGSGGADEAAEAAHEPLIHFRGSYRSLQPPAAPQHTRPRPLKTVKEYA